MAFLPSSPKTTEQLSKVLRESPLGTEMHTLAVGRKHSPTVMESPARDPDGEGSLPKQDASPHVSVAHAASTQFLRLYHFFELHKPMLLRF